MELDTAAIVCGLRNHGEHGTIARMFAPEHGLLAAYVRGGRGRRMRPVLIPGNLVSAQLRWRTEAQLPQATVELAHSRAPILGEPLQSAAVEWATALVASALPERQPYPRLYQAFSGLLDAIEAAPSASGWAAALAKFELMLVAELGYGADAAAPQDLLASFQNSGDQIFRNVLTGRTQSLQDSRARLLDRLRRASS
jgi:DNA repair protein RecO (recombination protein O)